MDFLDWEEFKMKFSCNREELLDAINKAEKAVAPKSPIPVMEGILLETSGMGIKLTGNDASLAIEAEVRADVETDGKIVLNSRMFSEIIRKTGDSSIIFESDEQYKVKITSGFSVFEIAGMDYEEFPTVNRFDISESVTIESVKLRSMIKQTIFATSKDEKTPVLTGILFKVEEGQLSLIAVDKTRFAIRREEYIECDLTKNFIVPFKTLNELLKILGDEGNVTIHPARNFILFSMDGCKIYSRSIEGEFVKYEHILESKNSIICKAKTSKLLNTFERVSPLLNFESIKSPVKIRLSGDTLIIDCQTLAGKVHDEMNIEKLSGDDLEIGFNNKFLLDAFSAVDSEEIYVEFSTPQTPIKITPTKGNKFVYLILPVLLKRA